MGRKGLNLYDLGRLEEAISYYKVLDVDSNNSAALYYKGLALDKLDIYADAIDVRNQILVLDSNNIGMMLSNALDLSHLGKYEQALVYYDKVLTINPDGDIALNGKGEALLKL